MQTLRHLSLGTLVALVVLTGGVMAGVGPFADAPHDGTPGWQGPGHQLLSNQSISIGERLTARVAAAAPTADGGRIVVGYRRFSLRAFTDDRVATAWRVGPDGEIQWRVDLAANESYADDIVATEDGFAVAGGTDGEVFLVRLSPDGTLSDRLIVDRDDIARIGGLAATDDGGVVLVGYENLAAPDRPFSNIESRIEDRSGWAIRTDGDGNKVWTREFDAVPKAVIADEDGYVVAGRVSMDQLPNTSMRPWLQHFSGEEGADWTRTWSLNDTELTTLAPSADGYVIGGRLLRFDTEARDPLFSAAVFGTTAVGRVEWGKVLTATGGGTVTDATSLEDGSVALAATVDTDQATNVAVLTADGDGVTGATVLGGPRFDSASTIWTTENGTFAVTGDTERDDEADRRNILLVDLRVSGIATDLLSPADVARSRSEVTLSPTTTAPDVIYGDDTTETNETEATQPTDTEGAIVEREASGLPLLGIAVYLLPFAVVAAILFEVKRRLR
jgi:hypothetical protein